MAKQEFLLTGTGGQGLILAAIMLAEAELMPTKMSLRVKAMVLRPGEVPAELRLLLAMIRFTTLKLKNQILS